MTNDLHITLTPFAFASRIVKETDSIIRSGIARHVYVLALHEDGLMEHEEQGTHRTVRRVRLRSRNLPRNFFGHVVKYIEFWLYAVKYAHTHRMAIVNVHSLNLLPIGVFLKYYCDAKLVYDTHELETERMGWHGLRKTCAKIIERLLIEHADLVIVVSDAINRWYRQTYGLTHIVSVLNCPLQQSVRKGRLLHQELHIPEDKKIILYQGGLARGRGIEQLLKAFVEMQDPAYALVFMGYGELDGMIRKEYAGSQRGVYCKAAVNPSAVLEYTASADIGIHMMDGSCLNHQYALPNKLFEYIMGGIPVIVSNLMEMRRVVHDQHIGMVVDDLTSVSLSAALDELAHINAVTMRENLDRAAARYSWAAQERGMIDAYKTFVISAADTADSPVLTSHQAVAQ